MTGGMKIIIVLSSAFALMPAGCAGKKKAPAEELEGTAREY